MNMHKINALLVSLAGVVLGLAASGCGSQSTETPAREERPSQAADVVPDEPAPFETRGAAKPPRPGPAGPDGSRVRVGQVAPDFEVTTTDGRKFRLSAQRGKVVLINFFATWCQPCLAEMPHLQKDVFEKIKSDRFVMLALGREHDNPKVARFKGERGLGFLMAGDPDRALFGLYAEKSIPRTVVVDTDGRVLFQSIGFSEKEFQDMVKLIRAKLERRP